MGWDALLEAYSGEGFQRKRDVHREVLYARIIALWESPLGGRFGVSSTGPLARFLDAALDPILGLEMLGLDGIKAVLQREKNRREYAIGEARRLKKNTAGSATGFALIIRHYEGGRVLCTPIFATQSALTQAALARILA
jgi:hypothetical protein